MSQTITDVMGQIRGGYAIAQAGKKLEEVVAAVRATNKPGEVTLTIKVTPDKTDERVVVMKPSVKCKVPEKEFSTGIFFVAPDGRLSKEDPAQTEMALERAQRGVSTIQPGGQRSDDAHLAKVGTGTDG